MSNRYLAWTLLIAACGLQAYFVITGSRYFIDLETVTVPRWLYGLSHSLAEVYLRMPFVSIIVFTYFFPIFLIILSWVFLALRRKSGWILALLADLFIALPSLALVSVDLALNLKYHRLRIDLNPEVLPLALAILHILILSSPLIRTLITPPTVDARERLTLPITSAR